MSATVSRSDPVPIPNVNDAISYSYKEIVRNLTANAPQPYGAIPPLMKKHKSKKKRHSRQKQQQKQQKQAVRRMSHVENWVAVDSKESIPDEDELIHSPFQNFLSVDFLTGILPLHMPPPSLSDPTTLIEQQEIAKFAYHHRQKAANIFDASDAAVKRDPNTLFDQDDDDDDDDDDEDDDDDDDEDDDDDDEDESDFSPPDTMRSTNSRTTGPKQQNLGAANDTPPLSLSLSPPLPSATAAATITTAISASTTGLSTEIDDIAVGNTLHVHKSLVGRRSIPSFTKSHTPSTSTTTSYAMSSSPPDQPDRKKWIHTIAKLRQSLALSQPPPSTASNSFLTNSPAAAATTTTIDIIAATKPCSKSLPSSLSSSPDHHASNEKLAAPLPPLKKSSSTATTSKKGSGFIPMPLPPRRKRSGKKRRSEATTQPRFNFDTNTYTRDTRSNPDHLRMIAAELNMMRSRKLFSPLKPRGFLPRRKDPFICGDGRLRSPLQFELKV